MRRHCRAITAAYEGAPATLGREGIDDRAVDLWSPLVALATVADAEDRGKRVPEVLAAAKALGTLRDADAEGGGTTTLLDALEAVRTGANEKLTSASLLSALLSQGGWEQLTNVRRLAAILNPLGIARHQVRDIGGRRWCYILDAAQLADLRARYGGGTAAPDRCGDPLPDPAPLPLSYSGTAWVHDSRPGGVIGLERRPDVLAASRGPFDTVCAEDASAARV